VTIKRLQLNPNTCGRGLQAFGLLRKRIVYGEFILERNDAQEPAVRLLNEMFTTEGHRVFFELFDLQKEQVAGFNPE
jgi:hypothetical protein